MTLNKYSAKLRALQAQVEEKAQALRLANESEDHRIARIVLLGRYEERRDRRGLPPLTEEEREAFIERCIARLKALRVERRDQEDNHD